MADLGRRGLRLRTSGEKCYIKNKQKEKAKKVDSSPKKKDPFAD